MFKRSDLNIKNQYIIDLGVYFSSNNNNNKALVPKLCDSLWILTN